MAMNFQLQASRTFSVRRRKPALFSGLKAHPATVRSSR